MPTYIKPGYWITTAHARKGMLELNKLITDIGGGAETLQTVVDAGNKAQSTDTNSFIKLDYRDAGAGEFDSFFQGAGGTYSQIYNDLSNIYIGSYLATGQYCEVNQSSGRLSMQESDSGGTLYTTVDFQVPVANTTIKFPAPTVASTYTFATSVGGVNAAATGDVALPFTALDDVTATYAGNAGQLVAVNGTEDGLELTAAPTELLTHFETLTAVDMSVLGTYSYTLAPSTTTNVKVISCEVLGFITFDVGNGNMININEIAGVEYTIDIKQFYYLDDVGTNIHIEVTDIGNGLLNDSVVVKMLYLDEATPGGK